MSARAKFTWPRFAVEEVHRFLAILTGVFLALHGIALLARPRRPDLDRAARDPVPNELPAAGQSGSG